MVTKAPAAQAEQTHVGNDRIPQNSRPILGMQDLADRYGVSLQAVRRWRVDDYGPTGFRVGRFVKYRLEDVLAWEQAQAHAA
ncbi:helix-turn-helix transcriptional regulator [Kocuria sp. KH4]